MVTSGGWRLVQHQPVQAQLTDAFRELGEVDGFADVTIGSEIVAAHDVLLLLGRGQNDDRKPLVLASARKRRNTSSPSLLGKFQDQEDHLGRQVLHVAPRRIDRTRTMIVRRLDPIANDDHLVPDVVLLERAKRESLVVGIVLHQQNCLFGCHPQPPLSSKREKKRGASAHGTFGPNAPAVPTDNALHRRKTDPVPGNFVASSAASEKRRTTGLRRSCRKPAPLSRTTYTGRSLAASDVPTSIRASACLAVNFQALPMRLWSATLKFLISLCGQSVFDEDLDTATRIVPLQVVDHLARHTRQIHIGSLKVTLRATWESLIRSSMSWPIFRAPARMRPRCCFPPHNQLFGVVLGQLLA